MEEYHLFDEYLKKSKSIREFCNNNEKLLFESIRMDIPTDGKIHWLNAVGCEIEKVISYIEKLENDRKPPLSFWE
jgi:hypothetical protein